MQRSLISGGMTMSIPVNQIAHMRFTRKADIDLSTFNLDIQMWNVVNALDAKRDVKTIAREDGYDLNDLHQKIVQLHQMGLIEDVGSNEGHHVSREAIQQLTHHLSEAMGPIAGILLDDTTTAMGYEPFCVPIHRLNELVERLSDQIQDPQMAAAFKQKAGFTAEV
jgi:hypothetical protein